MDRTIFATGEAALRFLSGRRQPNHCFPLLSYHGRGEGLWLARSENKVPIKNGGL